MEEIKNGYLRVTKCLQQYNNFDNIPPLVLHNACERGTKVHNYCLMYAKQDYFPTPDKELSGYLKSFQSWFDEMVERVLFTELRIYDDTYRITGAIDLIAILKNDTKPSIIDYKTSASKSLTWDLQLSAYHYLAGVHGGINPDRRIAIQLRKDGKYPQINEYTDPNDWELYKSALSLHRRFYG